MGTFATIGEKVRWEISDITTDFKTVDSIIGSSINMDKIQIVKGAIVKIKKSIQEIENIVENAELKGFKFEETGITVNGIKTR